MSFADEESGEHWARIAGKKVDLIPTRSFDPATRKRKADEIRKFYRTGGPFAFLSVELLDNRSEFLADLKIRVREEEGRPEGPGGSATAKAGPGAGNPMSPLHHLLRRL